jgi:hypothetical protein
MGHPEQAHQRSPTSTNQCPNQGLINGDRVFALQALNKYLAQTKA